MKNEPCIRLGMRIRPKISEKPDDSRNSTPPSARLLIARMAACADVMEVIISRGGPSREANTSLELRRRVPHRPLPPCGGGTGRGVLRFRHNCATPLPIPPPQGGREEAAAPALLHCKQCARGN